jgi:hypothetical protein
MSVDVTGSSSTLALLSTAELALRMRAYGLRSTSRAANIRRLEAIDRELQADAVPAASASCPALPDHERLRCLISGDARLYDRVLTFEPLAVTDICERASAAGIELKRSEIIAYFEREGVLYAQAWRESSATATRGSATSASAKEQQKKRRRAAAPATVGAQERVRARASNRRR